MCVCICVCAYACVHMCVCICRFTRSRLSYVGLCVLFVCFPHSLRSFVFSMGGQTSKERIVLTGSYSETIDTLNVLSFRCGRLSVVYPTTEEVARARGMVGFVNENARVYSRPSALLNIPRGSVDMCVVVPPSTMTTYMQIIPHVFDELARYLPTLNAKASPVFAVHATGYVGRAVLGLLKAVAKEQPDICLVTFNGKCEVLFNLTLKDTGTRVS